MRAGLRRRFEALIHALTPAATAARGITWAGRVGAVVLGALAGTALQLGYGLLVDLAAGALLGLLLTGLGELVFALVQRVVLVLDRCLGLAGAAALLASTALLAMFAVPVVLAAAFALVATVASALLGASLALLFAGDERRGRLVAGAAVGVAMLGALGLAVGWQGGFEDPTRTLVPARGATPPEIAELLERGPFDVDSLTYGSGTDRRRPEYRDGVAFRTLPVDGRPFLTGLSGWKASAREVVWGFGAKALPLNARVWYPRALAKPAPLILVVHGNHNMLHSSDPGYAWLGEHLASRGYVVASIDQNFLNSGPFVGGASPENDARAWLLLEHLARFREWNTDPAHPFHKRVDLERVVLIGHSRGGEAVGHAAAFNRLPFYPDDATVSFDYGFGLRGVIAIAPSDGQYQPSGKRTPIRDTSYLAIQGGWDSDVSRFLGDRQYQRVSLDPGSDHLKATLYLHHANHGQFNTEWGRRDLPAFGAWMLRLAPLLGPEDQRRAGKLFMTGFVEERLQGRTELRELFHDPEHAGAVLPPTPVAGRFSAANLELLADFEGDLDLATGSRPGVVIATTGLASWAEKDLRLRGKGQGGQRGDTAQILGWRRGDGDEPPTWALTLPEDLGPLETLSLDLAHLDQDPKRPGNGETEPEPEIDEEPAPAGALRPQLAFSIELVDAAGVHVRLPLADFGSLLSPLPVRHTKIGWLDRKRYHSSTEPIAQTFQLPLAAFTGANPDFDASTPRELRLVFDQSTEGVLAISGVGGYPKRDPEPGTGAPGHQGPEA